MVLRVMCERGQYAKKYIVVHLHFEFWGTYGIRNKNKELTSILCSFYYIKFEKRGKNLQSFNRLSSNSESIIFLNIDCFLYL